MTGPEHYKEAEEILARAKADACEDRPLVMLAVAVAQVHASLAMAAAAALNDGGTGAGMPLGDLMAWQKVAGVVTS